MQPKLGIIAGGGHLPRQIIDACRSSGRAFYVIAIEGHALPEQLVGIPHSWIRIGTAGTGFKILENEQVAEIVMIGDVKVPSLASLRPDLRTAKFFAKVALKSLGSSIGDNRLLTGAARELEKAGFKVIGVDDILVDLVAPEGVLGRVAVEERFAGDIALGISAAQSLGARDIGQAVIVSRGQVILEEDNAGTAEMIKRSRNAQPTGAGGVLVKLKKPGQDRRMDLPTIGVDTVLAAAEAGLAGIVIEAGETLIVDRAAVIAAANDKAIFLQALRLEEPVGPLPHVYMIAGEPSGDRLGARLMTALHAKTGGRVKISGVGGPEMARQGLNSQFPMAELTVMGLAEVLPRVPNLLRRIRETAGHILASKPDVVVTIDAPDFSLRVAKRLRGKNIPLIHYVAPSVWAWKPGRAKKMAPLLDHLLTLLPFEPAYFEREGLTSSFVGHSVIESGADQGKGAEFRAKHDIPAQAKLLCILPGSRSSEVSRLLPIIQAAIARLDVADLHIVLPTVETVESDVRAAIAAWPHKVSVVTGDAEKFNAFAAADAAIAASGTVALELALARVPYVTIYKFNALTAMIARRLVKTPYVNIINILLDREAVPELIQENCRADIIAAHISTYLAANEEARVQVESFDRAIAQLQNGTELPSEKAAAVVLEIIEQHATLRNSKE